MPGVGTRLSDAHRQRDVTQEAFSGEAGEGAQFLPLEKSALGLAKRGRDEGRPPAAFHPDGMRLVEPPRMARAWSKGSPGRGKRQVASRATWRSHDSTKRYMGNAPTIRASG